MNKLISKIVGVALGLSLAVGTGVAIGANSNVAKTNAEANSVTVNWSDFGISGTTLKSNVVEETTGYNFTLSSASGANGIAKSGNMTNTIAFPGAITNVSIAGAKFSSETKGLATVYVGATSGAQTTSIGSFSTSSDYSYNASGSYKFLTIVLNKERTMKFNSLTVTYAVASGPSLDIYGPNYLIDGGAAGSISGTITNDNSYAISWSASDEHVSFTPATSSSGSNVSVAFDGVSTGTTPVTITGTLNNSGTPVTATKDIYALENAGTSSNPFNATDAYVFAHSDYLGQSGGDWYVEGYVVGEYRNYNNVVKGYYIDENPSNTSSTKFEVYNFTNDDGKDIIVGTSYIKAHGPLTCYVNTNVTPNTKQAEFTSCSIYSIENGDIPSVVINGGDRTVDISDSLTLTATLENAPGATVTWSSGTPAVATINASTGVVTFLTVGTTEITASITVGGNTYTNSITLTVECCPVQIGKTYIISAVYNSTTYYLAGISNSIGTCSTTQSDALILTVEAGNTTGSFALQNNGNYLKAKNGNNLETETTLSDNSSWLITNDGTKDLMKNVGQSTRLLSYNHAGDTGDNTKNRFAAYTSQQSAAIAFTEVEAPEVDSIVLFGDSTADAEGAVSVTKEFLYEVDYVDPNNVGNSGVTVSILNSNDEATGASVTSGPSNGAFEVTFTASDTYTITVTSTETVSVSESTTIVVSNIYVAVSTDYALYSGTSVSGNAVLTEGDYIIYYDGHAAKSSVDSNRIQYEEVEPNNSVITTNLTSIVWHIAPAGDYYTIYNAAENKYLASTGSKNQAALIADGSDSKALWTVTIDNGTFEFENLARSTGTDPNNKWLRSNGTYGFACYASGTGGALSLYKKAYDAVDYSRVLLNYLGEVCDATNGNTDLDDLKATWAILSAEYNGLTSSVKSDLSNDSESATVLSALAAYDYVVGKYNKGQGVTDINDFMSRNPAAVGLARNIKNFIGNSSTASALLIIISAATLSFVGGYFFLRKKKEN